MPKLSFFLLTNDRDEWVDRFLSVVRRFLLGDASDFKRF
jgi:hypothetical protein